MAKKINYSGSSKVIIRICEAINDLIDHGGGGGINTSTASATSLSPGSDATVSTSISGTNIDFQFGIPIGQSGATGPQGPVGPVGPSGQDGVGVPSGGTTGQVLKKKSGNDYDTVWANESGSGSECPLFYGEDGSICIDYDLLEVR